MNVFFAAAALGLVVLAGRVAFGPLGALGLSRVERALAWLLAGGVLVGGLGVLLGTVGWFSPPVFFPLLALATGGAVATRRRFDRPALEHPPGAGRDVWLLLALVPVAVVLAVTGPFDWSLGGRDPGNYVNAAHGLARSGGFEERLSAYPLLPPEGRASALANDETGDQYASPVPVQGMYLVDEEQGTAVLQGFPLYPTLMAYARWFAGSELMLWTTPFLALVGVALVGALARRLGGSVAAVVAAGLLGLNLIQLWWGRFPNSEIAMQVFLLGGAWTFALAHELRSRALFGLAGAALGMSMLARPDSVLVVGVLAVVFVWGRLLGMLGREALTGVAAFGGVGAIAMLHAALVQGPYLEDVFHVGDVLLRPSNLALAGVPPAALAATYALRRPIRRRLEASARAGAIVAGVAVAGFGLASVALGWTGSEWLEVYFGPVGLGVAWLALGYLVYREWRHDRISRLGPLVFFALAIAVLYLREPLISVDLPWGTRRFLPVLVPTLTVAIGVAAARIARSRESQIAVAGVAVWLGAWQLWVSWPSLDYRMHEGSGDLVARIASRMDEDALVLLGPDYTASHKFAIPLAFRYGRDVLPFQGGGEWDIRADATAAWIRKRAMGRIVFLLMTKDFTKINGNYLQPYPQATIPFSVVLDAPDDSTEGPLPARRTWRGNVKIIRLDYKRID